MTARPPLKAAPAGQPLPRTVPSVAQDVDAPPVVVEQARSDEAEESTTLLAEDRDRALFAARVDPRTAARPGGQARVALDPSRLYFFSPTTGESLLGVSAAAS